MILRNQIVRQILYDRIRSYIRLFHLGLLDWTESFATDNSKYPSEVNVLISNVSIRIYRLLVGGGDFRYFSYKKKDRKVRFAEKLKVVFEYRRRYL